MTKIYLVKVTYLDSNSKYYEGSILPFTNYKKAKAFCEFKNLQIKLGISIWSDCKEVEFAVETMTICKRDWSKDLQELQIKNLPY